MRTLAALALAAVLPLTGCATILGTAVSPITGGVDLTRSFVSDAEKSRLWAVPFVFLGGAIGGPFVAFYNGVNHDASVFKSLGRYWNEFGEVFRPYEMVRRW
ncbi:MAG: hypothetical protein IT457_09020 [Planctomycetes bacterium]|nr:hypothetical protein [Planctomycetota bacterium]